MPIPPHLVPDTEPNAERGNHEWETQAREEGECVPAIAPRALHVIGCIFPPEYTALEESLFRWN